MEARGVEERRAAEAREVLAQAETSACETAQVLAQTQVRLGDAQIAYKRAADELRSLQVHRTAEHEKVSEQLSLLQLTVTNYRKLRSLLVLSAPFDQNQPALETTVQHSRGTHGSGRTLSYYGRLSTARVPSLEVADASLPVRAMSACFRVRSGWPRHARRPRCVLGLTPCSHKPTRRMAWYKR